jgi:hypothetical protein
MIINFYIKLMSGSYRKNPFIGNTTCKSEKKDKKEWHSRWRCHERIALSKLTLANLEEYLPIPINQVSNPWAMGKDGKSYWNLTDLKEFFGNQYGLIKKPKRVAIKRERKFRIKKR